MSLEKEFVPFDLNQKLIYLGLKIEKPLMFRSFSGELSYSRFEYYTPAILWQQAFFWFRETHGLHGDIYRNGTKYLFVIEDMTLGNSIDSCDIPMEYEESRLACLEKLIELTTCKSEN